VAEGWRAPALDATNPAARRWTEDALTTYLRTGFAPDHSAAGGPMAPVVEDLARVPDTDVRAIAAYIASKMTDKPIPASGVAPRDNTAAGAAFPDGATLFAGACAACHGPGAPMATQGRPSLAFASGLRDDDPTSTIQAILHGIEPPVGDRGPTMPAFADSLTDAELSAVAAYIRARFTDRPAWATLEATVRTARKESAQP
jgi:mono/diheme cytochrome c family protein